MEPSIEVSPEVRQGRNKLAATVVTGHAVKHIFNSSLQATILPEISRAFGLSGAQFGALSTAGRVTSGVTTMGAGYIGDRFAHKSGLVLAIAMLILGGSYFLLGWAQSYWYLFVVMLIAGIGPSLFHPPAIASLSRKFPDKRGFAISLHGTGGSVGNLVGPLLTGALLAGAIAVPVLGIMIPLGFTFDWREILKWGMIPAAIFAFLIFTMMRDIPTEGDGAKSSSDYFVGLLGLLKKKMMLALVLLTALRSMGQSAIQAFLPLYLRSDIVDGGLAYSPFVVALFISGAQVAGIGAQPLMGALSDRYGRKIVLVPALISLGLLYVGLALATPGYQLVIVVLAMGSFQYSLHSIFIAAAMDVSRGESQSTVVSLIYGAGFFGVLSPYFAGLISDKWGITNAFVYGGVVVILSAVILALLRLPKTANQEAIDAGN